MSAPDLNEMLVFAQVVRGGSFTAAARELAMPKSTVSRKVTDLEARLGARLLQRTTRTLRLTDVGRTYYEHCARIVSGVEEAERAVSSLQQTPRGLLRITSPLNFGFMGTIVAEFLRRHAEVQVELVCTDRVVGLVDEGFDLAVRAGQLADSTLVARRIARIQSYLVASAAYSKKRGRPKTPDDLAEHDCLLFGGGSERSGWTLRKADGSVEVRVPARLVVNDFDMLHEAVLAGLGIGLVPVHRSIGDLRAKRLERVLPEWCSPEVPIHAVYPSTRHLSAKMKAFLDFLEARMSPPPWEAGPAP